MTINFTDMAELPLEIVYVRISYQICSNATHANPVTGSLQIRVFVHFVICIQLPEKHCRLIKCCIVTVFLVFTFTSNVFSFLNHFARSFTEIQN